MAAIPTETTNGALARVLRVTERRVAAVKADGRLPIASRGGIDLAEIIRRGWRASLATGDAHQAGEEADAALAGTPFAPALDATHPVHRGFALAALSATYLVPSAVILAAVEAGVRRELAERLADLATVFLLHDLNDAARGAGLPDPEGTGDVLTVDGTYAMDWRRRVNWPGLYADDGTPKPGAAAEPVAVADPRATAAR